MARVSCGGWCRRSPRAALAALMTGAVGLTVIRLVTISMMIESTKFLSEDITTAQAAFTSDSIHRSPSTNASVDSNLNYVGCWIEPFNVVHQPGNRWQQGHMSLERCLAACRQRNFPFAAIMREDECTCQHDISLYKPAGARQCTHICRDNFSYMCGGSFATSIYLVGNHVRNTNATKVHLLAYHRTGSSFAGDILKRFPKSFYIYEPFWPLTTDGILKTDRAVQQAAQLMHAMLNCDFTKVPTTFLFRLRRLIQNKNLYDSSDAIVKFAECTHALGDGVERIDQTSCVNLLQFYCSTSPLRIVKTVRLQMTVTELLSNMDGTIKTIHLVRDPRPTMASQDRLQLLVGGFVKDDVGYCADVNVNILKSIDLRSEFLYFLRYEDLARWPVEVAKSVFEYLQLRPPEALYQWLRDVTLGQSKMKVGLLGTLKVNSKYKSNEWKLYFKTKLFELDFIQKTCAKMMPLCGYSVVDKSSLGNIDTDTTFKSEVQFKHSSTLIVGHI